MSYSYRSKFWKDLTTVRMVDRLLDKIQKDNHRKIAVSIKKRIKLEKWRRKFCLNKVY